MIFGNHIRNQENKLNQISSESKFQNFFLGMVYTLAMAQLDDQKTQEFLIAGTQHNIRHIPFYILYSNMQIECFLCKKRHAARTKFLLPNFGIQQKN